MRASRQLSPVQQLVLNRVQRDGPIPFAEFMETCLYDPEFGYYTQAVPSRPDDYYTSPEVHPIFGRLLARQFLEMWKILGCPSAFDLVELGAGNGTLAGDVLGWVAENSPDFAQSLRVSLIETSRGLQQQGRKRLQGRTTVPVQWAAQLGEGPYIGCMYSNECVDAFPVHRIVQRESGLREIYVGAQGDELVTEEAELSSPALAEYWARYGVSLALGQAAEINLAALRWLEGIARALGRGFLLTIDYGYLAPELYSAARPAGTLLAYQKHRVSEEVLASPGAQDLTAHVNFTALIEHGRAVGLPPLGVTTQTKFLLALGRENVFEDLHRSGVSESERYQARLRLKQLIYPEGMGETFKVLVQAKGLREVSLTGLREP